MRVVGKKGALERGGRGGMNEGCVMDGWNDNDMLTVASKR